MKTFGDYLESLEEGERNQLKGLLTSLFEMADEIDYSDAEAVGKIMGMIHFIQSTKLVEKL